MTVYEAARELGISENAVRMRVKRGTLAADKDGERLYVLLDTEPATEPTSRTDELIAELRDCVRSLEDQLGQELEANRENRRIIAALTSRIPELEAAPADNAPDAPGSPETAKSQGPREDFTDDERAQEAAQPRPWWRRMFGR